jgi:hypothetical protein
MSSLTPQRPGIESRVGGEIFGTRLDRPWGSTYPLYNGVSMPAGPGEAMINHPI